MAEPLVYVDRSEVLDGALPELERAIADLAEWIESHEPQLLAYNAYLSDDGRRMTVVHVHADPASLDRHMEVGGPVFGRFASLVRLTSIEVYGRPSERALRQLEDKARSLGGADVTVHGAHAGFSRLERPVAPG